MNRRDSGASMSVYCTSAVARKLRLPVKALFFGPYFFAFSPPGGLPDHVSVIRGLSIQAKVEEKAVFMRLQGH